MQNQNQDYLIRSASKNKNAKRARLIAAHLAVGASGEPLVRHGLSRERFSLFAADLAYRFFRADKSVEEFAERFRLLGLDNASAFSQAVADVELSFDGGKTWVSYYSHVGKADAPVIDTADLGVV